MMKRPSNMSRRRFLQDVLGITATVILPIRNTWIYRMRNGSQIAVNRFDHPADRIRGVSMPALLDHIGVPQDLYLGELVPSHHGTFTVVSTPKDFSGKFQRMMKERTNGS
jgi:hypothetical protein